MTPWGRSQAPVSRDAQGIRGDPAGQAEDPDAGGLRRGQGLGKGRVRIPVGQYGPDGGRLHDEDHGAAPALLQGCGELPQVPGAPLGGGVGEIADSCPLQSTALYLQEPAFPAPLQAEIQPGLPKGVFRQDV